MTEYLSPFYIQMGIITPQARILKSGDFPVTIVKINHLVLFQVIIKTLYIPIFPIPVYIIRGCE